MTQERLSRNENIKALRLEYLYAMAEEREASSALMVPSNVA